LILNEATTPVCHKGLPWRARRDIRVSLASTGGDRFDLFQTFVAAAAFFTGRQH